MRNVAYSLSQAFPGDLKNQVDEDFEVALVIYHESQSAVEPHILRLKYYIVLTCKKDRLPCSITNTNSQGVFKPVTSGTIAYHKDTNKSLSPESHVGGDQETDIITERVDWIGYYSTHEQSMQSVMNFQASPWINFTPIVLTFFHIFSTFL